MCVDDSTRLRPELHLQLKHVQGTTFKILKNKYTYADYHVPTVYFLYFNWMDRLFLFSSVYPVCMTSPLVVLFESLAERFKI